MKEAGKERRRGARKITERRKMNKKNQIKETEEEKEIKEESISVIKK